MPCDAREVGVWVCVQTECSLYAEALLRLWSANGVAPVNPCSIKTPGESRGGSNVHRQSVETESGAGSFVLGMCDVLKELTHFGAF